MGKLLAGQPIALLDHGHAAEFELALDEIYLPSKPVGERLLKVEKQPDSASLIRLAETMGAGQGQAPNLVLYPPGAPRTEVTRRIVTDQVLLRVSDVSAAEKSAAAAGLLITSQPEYAPDYLIAEARIPGVASGLGALPRLARQEGIISASPLLARQQGRRTTIPNDPLFSQQWHLQNVGQGGGTAGIDANVTGVWDTLEGEGITIAVVDNGVQLTHPDLTDNASPTGPSSLHYDWNDSPKDHDPTPSAANGDFHGTSVAGVAAARGGNNVGVSGAAPRAKIVGFRLIAGYETDADEGEAMTMHNDVIDLKNNSWGPADGYPWYLGEAGDLFLQAVKAGTETGRGGKGVIYTFAAGNGRVDGDQANKDAYANSIYTLAVGAVDNTGAQSYYSESGSNLVVCAPSNGGTRGIVTTDLVGNVGYNDGTDTGELSDRNYTNSFGGTSSATPLVTGVVALMLEANPNLTWRDVKEILLRSSTKLSPSDPGWVSRVVGNPALPPIKHNEKFGGGMIDAQAAVAMATTWPVRPPMTTMSLTKDYGVSGASIPDNSNTGVQSLFNFSANPPMRVEHVEVTVSATHQYRGDLEITLTSPGGVVSTLAAVSPEDDDGAEGYDGWTFSSVRHWGEISVGTWKVTVKDLVAGSTGNLYSVTVKLSGMDAAPQEIAVQEPVGTNLVDGSATTAFGNVATDNPGTRTFTVINTGDLPLTGIAATIDGTDAGDFSVTAPPPASLSGSGTTTFTVRFAPTTTGPKQAALHIASNDSDESPFDIQLTGNGTPPVGFFAFGAPAFTVNETDGSIQIPIVRSGGSFGAVSVNFNTVNGAAAAPADFTGQTGTVVDFADSVTDGTVAVSIVNGPTTSEANETFSVTLSNPTNGVRLGTPAQALVTIIDSSALSQATDTAAPGLAVVSYPTEGLAVNLASGATLTVTGTATDNKGVQKVEVSLNGGPFNTAALGIPGAPSTSFSALVTPDGALNTLQVRTTDYAGRSSIAIRSFKILRPFVVNVDPTLASVTAGFSPSSFREVGKTLTVTATPKAPTPTSVPPFAGAIFTGWTIEGTDVAKGNIPFTTQRLGIVASALGKPTITFIFREGLVLTAHFVPNPFTLMAGTYNGLIRPSPTLPNRAPLAGPPGLEDGSARTIATEGRFTATVSTTGAFSGTLTIDGASLAVMGAFDIDGNARFGTSRLLTQTVARVNKPSLSVELKLNVPQPVNIPDKITGTVTTKDFRTSVVTAVSDVDSDRAYYSTTGPTVNIDYLGPASANGTFTLIFPARLVANQTAGYQKEDYPQGHGTATITLTKAGVITVAGTLADGAILTASSALSETDSFPLFAQLYNKLGFLSGMASLNKLLPDSDMTAPDLQWLRPFQGTSQYYPYGWPVPIKVDMLGAKYLVTANQSVLKAPGGGPLAGSDDDGNVTLSFSEGQLDGTLNRYVSLPSTDVVTKVPSNDVTFTLGITRATGAFTGTFLHTDDTSPLFNGIIYQKGAFAGGYGYFLTKQPIPINYTGESGAVTLMGQ